MSDRGARLFLRYSTNSKANSRRFAPRRSILGLTILAWGNSVGDLSTNMSMAKRGLANMSITACFAGPVFNLLVGLGVGFNLLNNSNGGGSSEVEFSPAIWTGLAFMFSHCVLILVAGVWWNDGFIPAKFGYISASIYIAYAITCCALEFS